jgi:predicted cupin superfamily sugar epimerase
MLPASQIIKLLNLKLNNVEGGYFDNTYPLSNIQNPPSSAIYYFLDNTQCSIMHKVTGDMIYHFYAGHAVEMLLLYPEGHFPSSEVCIFSNDLAKGGKPMKVIPGGTWIGSKITAKNSWSLMGVTIAPAYNPKDYTLGDRETLIKQYPEQKELITLLTKPSVK